MPQNADANPTKATRRVSELRLPPPSGPWTASVPRPFHRTFEEAAATVLNWGYSPWERSAVGSSPVHRYVTLSNVAPPHGAAPNWRVFEKELGCKLKCEVEDKLDLPKWADRELGRQTTDSSVSPAPLVPVLSL